MRRLDAPFGAGILRGLGDSQLVGSDRAEDESSPSLTGVEPPTPLFSGRLEVATMIRTNLGMRYLVGMLNALETLIHEPRKGPPASEYRGSLIHGVRELLERRTEDE